MKNKKPGFTRILKYKFDNFMSKGGFSIFAALMTLFLAAFVLMSVIRFVANLAFPEAEPINFSSQLWRVFLQISDAGAVAEDSDNNYFNKITGILTILLGLVLFSSLVAFITSQFEAKLDELRKGKSDVIEQNHTLILGFSERVLEIIRELIMANESTKSAAIVVLSYHAKDEMDDFFRDHIDDRKTSRIITRSGLTSSKRMLDKVNIDSAKSVIILNDSPADDSEEEKEISDSKVLKTIMAVISSLGEENLPPLIAELHTKSKRNLAKTISKSVHCIEENSLLAKLMVQTSRTSGLVNVYDELVGFDGSEFYYHKPKIGWGGKKYKDLIFHFPRSSLIGYRNTDGQVFVNPNPETVFENDWEGLLIAEDDSTINPQKQGIEYKLPDAEPALPLARSKENQLIVGWSHKAAIIVNEYSQYLIGGSAIDVIVNKSDSKAKEEIKNIAEKYPGLQINLIEKSRYGQEFLQTIHPEKYDNVIILKQDGGNSELRDSETIAILLEFRYYFKQLASEVKTQLITEVADSENIEVIQQMGVRDFLISNKFVSKIYAQASEDPTVLNAYDEMFDEAGSEIYLKKASLFFPEFPIEVTFADVCAAAIKRRETAFGLRLLSEEKNEEKGFYINPAKVSTFTINADDYLITFAEDDA
ncbi:MAG: hypothetical protein KDK41_14085 [Leptospiraceae bacterium]|nr:hypothetical protein [Leptospiraceae bacterium]